MMKHLSYLRICSHVFHCTCDRECVSGLHMIRLPGHPYTVMPQSKSFPLLLFSRAFFHVVSMPTERKLVVKGVDKHVEEF